MTPNRAGQLYNFDAVALEALYQIAYYRLGTVPTRSQFAAIGRRVVQEMRRRGELSFTGSTWWLRDRSQRGPQN